MTVDVVVIVSTARSVAFVQIRSGVLGNVVGLQIVCQ
jgi:hypothetical protein